MSIPKCDEASAIRLALSRRSLSARAISWTKHTPVEIAPARSRAELLAQHIAISGHLHILERSRVLAAHCCGEPAVYTPPRSRGLLNVGMRADPKVAPAGILCFATWQRCEPLRVSRLLRLQRPCVYLPAVTQGSTCQNWHYGSVAIFVNNQGGAQ